MKKNELKKRKPYQIEDEQLPKLSEPSFSMQPINRIPAALKDFPFSKFKKIADKVPLTQTEWASILHLSERTLQRYSKDNKSFEGIYVDRILQLEKLINEGLETFADADTFYRWLKRDKSVLGNELSFESLYHSEGIQQVLDEIGRIQHGIYI
jgi:putative toxin-antitoxin system antitoxin component (TIGR02293 family)